MFNITTDNKDVLKTIFSKIDMFKTINFEDFLRNLKESEGVITGSKIFKLLSINIDDYDDEIVKDMNNSDLDICLTDYNLFSNYLMDIGFINTTPINYTNDYSMHSVYGTECIECDFAVVKRVKRYSIDDFDIDIIICDDPLDVVCNTFDLKYCARCVDADFIQYSNCNGLVGATDYQIKILEFMLENVTQDSFMMYNKYLVKFNQRIIQYDIDLLNTTRGLIYDILKKCHIELDNSEFDEFECDLTKQEIKLERFKSILLYREFMVEKRETVVKKREIILNNRIKTNTVINESLKDACTINDTTITSLNESIELLKNNSIMYDTTITSLNTTITSLNESIELLKNNSIMYDTTITSLNTTIELYKSTTELLKDNTVNDTTVTSLHETITSLHETITSLHETITSLNGTIETRT